MRVAGMISGTSVDGIDVAIVDIGSEIRVIAHGTVPYPGEVRQAILGVSNTNTHTAQIARLNFLLGELFTGALGVRDDYREGKRDAATLEAAHTEYVTRLLDLTDHPRSNAANNTFAQHLYGHGEQWLMFLIDPDIPATNHRAEQALKTPIVNRKVWGGNRTEAGARAQEVTSSVLQTCKNLTVDAFSYLSNAFRGVVGNLFATHPASQLT